MQELLNKLLLAAGVQIFTDGLSNKVAAVPEGYDLESLEKFQDNPARVRETATLSGVTDFVAYVDRHKNDGSAVFIAPNISSLKKGAILATAVIDYHHKEANSVGVTPEWGTHRALLAARASIGYDKLMEMDGVLMDQAVFARKLEEVVKFAVSAPQADLLEMARTLNLSSKGDFKNIEDEFSGSVDFTFAMSVSASSGTSNNKISVPTEIVFDVPLIDGMDSVPVAVKFLYRTPSNAGEKVQCGIKIIDRVYLEDEAIREVSDFVRIKTGLDTFVGTISKSD